MFMIAMKTMEGCIPKPQKNYQIYWFNSKIIGFKKYFLNSNSSNRYWKSGKQVGYLQVF